VSFELPANFALHLIGLAQLGRLLEEGRDLIRRATDYVRNMLHGQATIPIIDAVTPSEDGRMIEVDPLPLFLVVSREERAQFFEYLKLLSQWYQKVQTLL
jgi:hypothetical protein